MQVQLPRIFPECTIKGSEPLCSLCSLTVSDITILPLHFTSLSAGIIMVKAANEIKQGESDLGETVADAFGPHESNMQFFFDMSSLHI